ncbi:hypothetical protein BDV10DRAFT_193653 [Aspergillus recurvatus]
MYVTSTHLEFSNNLLGRLCRSKGQACKSTEDGLSPRRSSREIAHSDNAANSPVVDTNYTSIPSILSPELGPSPLPAGLPTSPRNWIEAASQTPPHVLTSPLSENEPTVDTLEDNENRTAHSLGLAGEQDTDLLASFRSVITNERDGISADVIQVSSGDLEAAAVPVRFNLLVDEFQPADDLAKQRISEKIEAMHVHPVYCVVSKVRFLRACAEDKLKIPASLRGAVYGLGSTFWQHDPDVEGTLQFDLHSLFEAAQLSLQRELHAPNLWGIQACLLLLHERPADSATIETPRTWKKLRKKLWWATYMSDIWASVCHGNPLLVYPRPFTTTPPEIDDLAFDEDVPTAFQDMVDISSQTVDISTSARFMEMVKLSRVLHELIDSY